jgi:micrococcal nuclease
LSARQHIKKRASQWGALFITCLIFSSVAQARECPADRIHETAVVAKVVDGDTLKLEDGRLVRFIGINTPEMAKKGVPAEPFARQAKLAVKMLLEDSLRDGRTVVGLQYDAERKDRHGRTLAHIYLEDGRSVQADLLTNGLAAQIVVPPNQANKQCYREAELTARDSAKGVWSGFYKPVAVEHLPRDTRGFRVISGRVIDIGESRQSIWLNFPRRQGESRREGVAVRIHRKDLGYFRQWKPQDLKNRRIIVRGWMFPYKKQLVMRARHPLSIEIIKEDLREKKS